MSSDIAISVKNLTKTYRIFGHPGDRIKQALTLGRVRFHNEFTALRDVSFEIKKGEAVGIIGRNGSGKSTLLQLICGILKPTSGAVQVNGRVCALLELGSGFNPEFTGRENIYFQGAVAGFSRQQVDERVADIIAFADIGEFIDQPVRTYSSGMFVRLAFAVIAHADAEILVVDEALAVGDAVFTQKCMRFLRNFMNTGTVLLVSHDLAIVGALCERVLWIEGRLRDSGAAGAICESYLASSLGLLPARSVEVEVAGANLADQRHELLLASNLRNDLEVFCFNPNAVGSGTGLATIVDVRMENTAGARYCYVVGGEPISLVIRAKAHAPLASPIIGFVIQNRLGQALIGDNTYLSYASQPVAAPEGAFLEARFHFRMPRLPTGDYVICVTIAEGVPGMHQIHHRINEAIVFQSQTSSVVQVMVGLPMLHIELSVVPQDDSKQ